MLADQTEADGSSVLAQADNLSRMLYELVSLHLVTRDSMVHSTTVEVYPVLGGTGYACPPCTGYTSTVVLCFIESLSSPNWGMKVS